jgi:hypothetical protein
VGVILALLYDAAMMPPVQQLDPEQIDRTSLVGQMRGDLSFVPDFTEI